MRLQRKSGVDNMKKCSISSRTRSHSRDVESRSQNQSPILERTMKQSRNSEQVSPIKCSAESSRGRVFFITEEDEDWDPTPNWSGFSRTTRTRTPTCKLTKNSVTSPQKFVTSPQKCVTSPQKCVTSPPKCVMSPLKQLTSPMKHVTFASKQVTSPIRLFSCNKSRLPLSQNLTTVKLESNKNPLYNHSTSPQLHCRSSQPLPKSRPSLLFFCDPEDIDSDCKHGFVKAEELEVTQFSSFSSDVAASFLEKKEVSVAPDCSIKKELEIGKETSKSNNSDTPCSKFEPTDTVEHVPG